MRIAALSASYENYENRPYRIIARHTKKNPQ
jgi:hypothetical protein